MKHFFALLITFFITAQTFSAAYLTRSFSYGGVTRQYLLYVPAAYDGSTAYPFVMALHGLGDNMNNFKGINMNAVADTAHFILAIPQALVDPVFTQSTAWNSGAGQFGVSLNANVDDVGFLNALIDTVSANYNVDQTRVYSTGFSMGGFMSNRLACELNNRIAAIASISGTIGSVITCQPARAIPVAHFHGTADATINYTGNPFGNDPEALVSYWMNHDHCDTTPVSIDTFPNIANDGKIVVHYKYTGGSYSTRVEFFKVIGGAHEWLGPVGNDINYAVEIWRFFRDFQWTAQTNGIPDETGSSDAVNIYPNPSSDYLNVVLNNFNAKQAELMLYDITGEKVFSIFTENTNGNISIPLSNLSAGVYVLKFAAPGLSLNKKIVVQR